MRTISPIYVNIILAAIILTGFACTTVLTHSTSKSIIANDIENIVKLTSSNIYSEIDIALTRPIYVGTTIANDSFLKQWMKMESTTDGKLSPGQLKQLTEYLLTYKTKYGYNSFSVISQKTGNYYHFNGLHKKISPNNNHDVWYYNFVAKNIPYTLNIDTDEADNNVLTVFVDNRIEDTDGTLLGVTGVGIKMRNLQALFQRFESEYNLRAFLVDSNGVVRVHANSKYIGERTLRDLAPRLPAHEAVLKRDRNTMLWYPNDDLDTCLSIRFIENMDWYLVVDKNTSAIRQFYYAMIRQDVIIATAVTLLAALLISLIVSRYNRLVFTIANTDETTRLPNRKAFSAILSKHLSRLPAHVSLSQDGLLFLCDIDDFKMINDRHGHLFGNEILAGVAAAIKTAVGEDGALARWGGDEFAGFLSGPIDKARERLDVIMQSVVALKTGEAAVSISVGATRLSKEDQPDELFRRADSLLYAAKANGKNQIRFDPFAS